MNREGGVSIARSRWKGKTRDGVVTYFMAADLAVPLDLERSYAGTFVELRVSV